MISIIVPIYNVEDFLEKCLDSIIDQSYKDFEVICVDDGATDGSVDILNKYIKKDNRFKLIRQSNKGLSSARNTGLKHAKGEHIYFLDSDDFIHPETLNITLYYIKKYNLDFVNFGYESLTSDNITHKKCLIYKNDFKILDNILEIYLKQTIAIPTNVWSNLYTRESIGNLKFEEGIYFEDLLYTTLYFSNNVKGIKIPHNFYYYRNNPKSITNSGFSIKKAKDYLHIFSKLHICFKDSKYNILIKNTILPRIIKDIIKYSNKSNNKKEIIRAIRPEIITAYKKNKFNLTGLTFSQKIKLLCFIYKLK